MKTKVKIFVSFVFILISTQIIMIGCQKELSNDHDEPSGETSDTYILSPLDFASIPCDSPYYILIKFENSEIYFSLSDSNISLIPSSSSGYGNMNGKGFAFRNNASSETAEISFYKPEADSTFLFQIANYRFGNPWYSISGANIELFCPTEEPYTFYRYLGTNVTKAYFWITWLDENRICGQFKTKLVECCGGNLTFLVEGEFSIPRVTF